MSLGNGISEDVTWLSGARISTAALTEITGLPGSLVHLRMRSAIVVRAHGVVFQTKKQKLHVVFSYSNWMPFQRLYYAV